MLCSLSMYTIQRRRSNKDKEKLETILYARERKTNQHKTRKYNYEVRSKHIFFCFL